MARIVVIGSGLGGLAAALRLQAAGHSVVVVEAAKGPGGRAGLLRLGDYVFDMGPTIITAPQLLADLWAAAGRDLPDYVDLRPLWPYYEICFRDGSKFADGGRPNGHFGDGAAPDVAAAMETEVARMAPGDLAGYRRLMAATRTIYHRAFEQLAHHPFHSLVDFARIVPELLRLGAQQSVYDYVAGFIADERLRIAFSFHPLFIGGDPFRASAIYSIVPYLEQQGGVWFARGGMYAVVRAMVALLGELGGELRCGAKVAEIVVRGGRAAGVRLEQGGELAADLVVSNADVAATYLKLLPPAHRRPVPSLRLPRLGYSMSCFLLYLGLDRQYPHLHRHTILMPHDYRGVVRAIFRGRLLEDDLALYLHAPTRTDPGLAPPGGESVYALVPVPNLAGNLDWPAAGDRLRRRVLALMGGELGMGDVERHIVCERRLTPLDFRDGLGSYLGAGFSIEPTLFQSAYFRPHNRSAALPGLYLVGAGTHPGAGLPGVLLSAEITANLIAADTCTASARSARR